MNIMKNRFMQVSEFSSQLNIILSLLEKDGYSLQKTDIVSISTRNDHLTGKKHIEMSFMVEKQDGSHSVLRFVIG